MFFKLSFNNMKKSVKDYTIYFMTLIFGVCIFYVFNSIDEQSAMLQISSSKKEMILSLVQVMSYISIFVSVILGYLIVYANNFLIKRRKKEFGLYQTLGMGKRKITLLLFMETILVGLISLAIGLFIGVFASQGISVVIAKMFEADLSKYTFSFSAKALGKTCIFFGIIYACVMLFNMITISRFKLINLINASKKNEKLKVRNPIVTIIMFIGSVVMIGVAYYLLIAKHVELTMDRYTIVMIVLGSVGTFLFFASLAGFMLRMVQMSKRTYLKNLNMFVLRQLNSKVNTATVSITIISLMLLLSISILSTCLSMVSAFNQDLGNNNLSDVSFYQYETDEKKLDNTSIISDFDKIGFDYKSYFSNEVEYTKYSAEDSMSNYMGPGFKEEMTKEFGEMVNFDDDNINVIKESEYNRLMDLYGKENKKVNLAANEYVLVANYDKVTKYLKQPLKDGKTITVNGTVCKPQKDECIDVPLSNSNFTSEMGTFIVDDSLFVNNKFKIAEKYVCANYNVKSDDAKDKLETKMLEKLDKLKKYTSHNPYTGIYTKLVMEASTVGLTAIVTFIGLYLGIIFSITSAAVLAIGQLSESSDNKERYAILRKIGVDQKMINRSLFMQIGIYFMLPLVVAVFHSVVAIHEMSRIISLYGQMNLSKNILITAAFIVVVYGGYFYATYLGSKGIIKE